MCEFAILDMLDKNGVAHTFVCEAPEEDQAVGDNYTEIARTFTYRIKTNPNDQHFFEFTSQEEGPDRLRVATMNNHFREEYRSKGIPEAMIMMLVKTTSKKVTSS